MMQYSLSQRDFFGLDDPWDVASPYATHTSADYMFYQMHVSTQQYNIAKNFVKMNREIVANNTLQGKLNFINSLAPSALEIHTPTYYELKESIGDLLYNIASWAVNETQINILSGIIAILSTISASLQGNVIYQVTAKYKERSPLQTIVFSTSGTMKSAFFERIINPVQELDNMAKQNYNNKKVNFVNKTKRKGINTYIKNILDVSGGLLSPNEIEMLYNEIEDYEKELKKLAPRDTPREYLLSQATDYGLKIHLQTQNGSVYYASPEADGLQKLLDHKQYELILKGYSQEAVRYVSGRANIDIPCPSLYLFACGQLQFAQKYYANPAMAEQGVTARFLPILNVQPTPLTADVAIDGAQEIYRDKVQRLFRKYDKDGGIKEAEKIYFEPEAANLIQQFRQEIKQMLSAMPKDDNTEKWASKLHGQAVRLAGAIHMFNHVEDAASLPVSSQEMTEGIALAKELFNHASFLYHPMGFRAVQNAIKIFRSLRRISTPNEQMLAASEGLTTAAIQQRTDLRKLAVNDALYYLEGTGWMAVYDNGCGNIKAYLRNDFFANRLP